MDFRAIGERVFNNFASIDEEMSAGKREILNAYLNRITDHVNATNGSPTKHSSATVRSSGSNNLSTHHDVSKNNNNENELLVRGVDNATTISCSHELFRQKRISSDLTVEGMEPDAKRRRLLFNPKSDVESSEDIGTILWSHPDSTMAQLTGNFSLAMDLWTDAPCLDGQSKIDDDSSGNLLLVEVTDEEMNIFWDTVPKEFSGLM